MAIVSEQARPPQGAAREAGEQRVPVLDGLRGVAILLVLFFHFATTGSALPTDLPSRLTYTGVLTGWIGVDLFFVLSGFLITGILYDARGRRHYFRNFYMRRVLRIFPLYYAALLVCLAILPALLGRLEYPADPAETPWFLLYLTNVRIAQHGWDPSGMLGHFWTLAVEEQFYLFWPLVVLACGARTLIRTCVAILIGSLLLRVALHEQGHALAAYVLTPARFDSLAIGALLAVRARSAGGLHRHVRAARILASTSATAILALIVLYRGLPPEAYLIGTAGYSLFALFFGAVLLLVVTAPAATRTARAFASPVLRFFGRYSYGLYVIHQPLLLLLPAWWSIEAWQPWLGSWIAAYLVFSCTAMLACVAVALASWHLLEERFLRLKARFAHPARSETVLHVEPDVDGALR
jgi:peptidoglycan/LPS O-acetylase OafA/YrhL